MTYVVNRGPWEMVIVYEKKTKWIYTIMREARFASIRHNTPKRRRMHYLDMFTRHFNSDLLAPIGQTHMFTKEFADEYELSELVGKMLYALQAETDHLVAKAVKMRKQLAWRYYSWTKRPKLSPPNGSSFEAFVLRELNCVFV